MIRYFLAKETRTLIGRTNSERITAGVMGVHRLKSRKNETVYIDFEAGKAYERSATYPPLLFLNFKIYLIKYNTREKHLL